MIHFKGNRISTPCFHFAEIDPSSNRLLKGVRDNTAFYTPISTPNTLFEHTVLTATDFSYEVTVRGIYSEGRYYPLCATVTSLLGSRHIEELYLITPKRLPAYFKKGRYFINPFEGRTGDVPDIFRIGKVYTSWFKSRMVSGDWAQDEHEKYCANLVRYAIKHLDKLVVEKQLLGVSLYGAERLKWLGALILPVWTTGGEHFETYTKALRDYDNSLNEVTA